MERSLIDVMNLIVSVSQVCLVFVEAIHRERYKSVTFAAGDKCQVRVVFLYNAVRL